MSLLPPPPAAPQQRRPARSATAALPPSEGTDFVPRKLSTDPADDASREAGTNEATLLALDPALEGLASSCFF